MNDYFESIAQQFEVKLRSLGGRDYAVGLGLTGLVFAFALILVVIVHDYRSRLLGATSWNYAFLGGFALLLLCCLGFVVALERDTRNLKKVCPKRR